MTVLSIQAVFLEGPRHNQPEEWLKDEESIPEHVRICEGRPPDALRVGTYTLSTRQNFPPHGRTRLTYRWQGWDTKGRGDLP